METEQQIAQQVALVQRVLSEMRKVTLSPIATMELLIHCAFLLNDAMRSIGEIENQRARWN